MGGETLEVSKSRFAETQETGRTLVSVAGLGALETQMVAHKSFVVLAEPTE
jgi:hypothetical protein